MNIDIKTLAAAFGRQLLERIGQAWYNVVVERNAAEYRAGVCHSYDVCDANVVMMKAVMRHGMDEQEAWIFMMESPVPDRAWDAWRAAPFGK